MRVASVTAALAAGPKSIELEKGCRIQAFEVAADQGGIATFSLRGESTTVDVGTVKQFTGIRCKWPEAARISNGTVRIIYCERGDE